MPKIVKHGPTSILGTLVASAMLPSLAIASDSLDTLVLGGQLVTPSHIAGAPIDGWQEVMLPSGEIFYTDPEQRYVIVGTLYENAEDRLINVTEVVRRKVRLEALAAAKDSVVTYQASDEIAEITVFTDPSCPYCEMLHGDIDAINAAGITVNYLPFPRMGLNHPVAHLLAEIWCSEDPQAALNTAFNPGLAVQNDAQAWEQCSAAVEQGYVLGHEMGVQGTPAMVLPNGEVGEGYLPTDQLVQAVSLSQ